MDFQARYRKWNDCQPADLFEAPTQVFVADVSRLLPNLHGEPYSPTQDKKPIADNIAAQAKYASILFIWTDCDREGEHIGSEIRGIAIKANPSIQVWRARFSNIERAYVLS